MNLKARIDAGGTPIADHWGVDSETGRLRDVLVGPIDNYTWQPGNAIAQRSSRLGRPFDKQMVISQYEEMIAAYESADVEVHRLPAEDGLPYQVYARDSSVMTPWGAIIMQLQKPYRWGEYASVLRFYMDNNIPVYDLVTSGNAEGGDMMVLKPGLAICGYSGERSSESAVNQIKSWFEAEGWEFFAYAFDPHFLHLDVQMGMITKDLAVVCVEAVEPELLHFLAANGISVIPISYGEAMNMGTNIVSLGDERVLVPKAGTTLIEKCRAQGLEVFDPDVSMIAQGGGSVHCMCQALRRDSI